MGVLVSDTDVCSLQEVRLRDEPLRAARAESKRHIYHGQRAPAKRIGPCGPASGGLATLVCESRAFRPVTPERPGLNWRGGRWTHTAIGASGTQIHVINVYGWLFGTPDFWRNQNALWKEMFNHIAGLGDSLGLWRVIGRRRPTSCGYPPWPREPQDCCLTSGAGSPVASRSKGSPRRRISASSATVSVGRLPATTSCPWGSSSSSPSGWPPSGNRSGPSGSPGRSRTLRWGGTPPGRPPSPLDQGGGRGHRGPAGLGRLDQGS